MRNLVYVACFALLMSTGCKKIDKLTQFEMKYDQTMVIPDNSVLDVPISSFTPDMQTNSSSTFAVNDTRKDKIEEIRLTELVLTMVSPSDADFSFLESLKIFISADDMEEREIAGKENIGETETVLQLDVTNIDLKEYIKKDNFSLRLESITDETISEDHEVLVQSVFFVDAKVLGQ